MLFRSLTTASVNRPQMTQPQDFPFYVFDWSCVLNVADDLSRNHTSEFACACLYWDVHKTQVAQSSQKDPQGKFLFLCLIL